MAVWEGMLVTDLMWGISEPFEFMEVVSAEDSSLVAEGLIVNFKVRPVMEPTAMLADLICHVTPGERDLAMMLPYLNWELRIKICSSPDTRLSNCIKWKVIASTLSVFDKAEMLVATEEDEDFVAL